MTTPPLLETIKFYQESNLCMSTDVKFRKVHDKFKSHQNEKSYNKLICYLRIFSDKNKIDISKDYVLIYCDNENVPIFNSCLEDNKFGNCFENYVDKKIKFNDKYQKKSSFKANSEGINVTFTVKKISENKYQKFFYTSNFVGSVVTSGFSTLSRRKCCNCKGYVSCVGCIAC